MKKLHKITIAALATTMAFGLTACGNNKSSDTQTAPAKTVQTTTAATPDQTTLLNNVSYAIGYGIGNSIDQDIQQNNIQLSTDQLKTGFQAGLSSTNPKYTQEQMQQIMTQYAEIMRTKMQGQTPANNVAPAQTTSQ